MAFSTLPPSGNAVALAGLLRAGRASAPSADASEDFIAAFAAHGGHASDRILLTDSGTTALYLALRGLSALAGSGRVAVPAWCCPSVPQAVIQAGLVPALIDLDPSTLAYDPESLHAARVHPLGLVGVILVHFFGMEPPRPQGEWKGIQFIRDCAQDFDYRPDADDPAPCVYSFGRGKALNAGHGGALCLPAGAPMALTEACRAAWTGLPESRARVWPKVFAINLLSEPRLFRLVSAMPGLGLGTTVWDAPLEFARIAPAFAPLGLVCLETWRHRRDAYRSLLGRYGGLARTCKLGSVVAPMAGLAWNGIPVRYPLLIKPAGVRDDLVAAARMRSGGVTRMYPTVLPGLPGAPEGLAGESGFPGARMVAETLITLPVTAYLIGKEDRFLAGLARIFERLGLRPVEAASETALRPGWRPMPAGMFRV